MWTDLMNVESRLDIGSIAEWNNTPEQYKYLINLSREVRCDIVENKFQMILKNRDSGIVEAHLTYACPNNVIFSDFNMAKWICCFNQSPD